MIPQWGWALLFKAATTLLRLYFWTESLLRVRTPLLKRDPLFSRELKIRNVTEVAKDIKRRWVFRLFERKNRVDVPITLISEIVEQRRQTLPGSFQSYERFYNTEATNPTVAFSRGGNWGIFHKDSCELYGISPFLIIAIINMVFTILRWWEARKR